MWSFRSFAIVAIAEAITGVKPDFIQEIVVEGIVVIVGVVGASGVSIWSLWPLTDFLALLTIKWTPSLKADSHVTVHRYEYDVRSMVLSS